MGDDRGDGLAIDVKTETPPFPSSTDNCCIIIGLSRAVDKATLHIPFVRSIYDNDLLTNNNEMVWPSSILEMSV